MCLRSGLAAKSCCLRSGLPSVLYQHSHKEKHMSTAHIEAETDVDAGTTKGPPSDSRMDAAAGKAAARKDAARDGHQSPLADSNATTTALTVSSCSTSANTITSNEEDSSASANASSEDLRASADSLTAAAHSFAAKKVSSVHNKYRIDPRLLGRGRNGSVRARTRKLDGERFAVKSINKTNTTVTPAGLAREISLLQQMDHPNIARLHDVYESTTYVHLALDLCTGGELLRRIGGWACVAEDDAARILRQVLSAVAYMHRHDIVHRDVKPGNILFVTEDDKSDVKIVDFDLARHHLPGEPPMTSIAGTAHDIAPEVLRQSYDKACDLWSVGITAYILIAGYPPFSGTDSEQTRRLVLVGDFVFGEDDWSLVSEDAKTSFDDCCRWTLHSE
ncbi:hypothetical protein ACHAXT_007645 [Thalassiosira profunda]